MTVATRYDDIGSSSSEFAERSKTKRNENSIWRLFERYVNTHRRSVAAADTDYDTDWKGLKEYAKCMIVEHQIAFFQWLFENRYSVTYARVIRDTIARHNARFVPWSTVIAVTRRTTGGTNDTATDESNRRRRHLCVGDRVSLKSDGRLTFTEREYDLMTRRCESEIIAAASQLRGGDNNQLRRYRTFLYTFYMLARTGKRLSDIAEITSLQLRQLRDRGVCVVKIRKTGKLGRIEIAELLLSSGGGDNTAADKETKESVRFFLDVFASWSADLDYGDKSLSIPFSVHIQRRYLDAELNKFYR